MKGKIPEDLIIKNLAGESTTEEDCVLWEWIDSDDEHQKIFNDAIEIYSGKDEMISKQEVESRLRQVNRYRHRLVTVNWNMAACLFLIGVSAAAVIWLNNNHVVQETSFGMTKRITLPDSSSVWLNGGTTIRYHKNKFEETRRISIEGEAYLEVVAGISPFVIEYDSIEASLDSGDVNIRTYPHELEKIAVVSTGSVTFRDARKGSLRITASTDDEVISRSDYGIIARSVNTNLNYKSWVTGIYVFKDEPIERVISVLGRGNTDLKVDDNDRDRLITGIFQVDQSAMTKEEILRLIDNQATSWD